MAPYNYDRRSAAQPHPLRVLDDFLLKEKGKFEKTLRQVSKVPWRGEESVSMRPNGGGHGYLWLHPFDEQNFPLPLAVYVTVTLTGPDVYDVTTALFDTKDRALIDPSPQKTLAHQTLKGLALKDLTPEKLLAHMHGEIQKAIGPRSVQASGYSVKRLEPETVLTQVELEGGRTFGIKTPKSVTFGVVDPHGKIVKTTPTSFPGMSPQLAKPQYEIYPRKQTAEQVADHFNKNPPKS
jgi:hypothetical protein